MTVIILCSLHISGSGWEHRMRVYIKVLGTLCGAVQMQPIMFLNGIHQLFTSTCQYKTQKQPFLKLVQPPVRFPFPQWLKLIDRAQPFKECCIIIAYRMLLAIMAFLKEEIMFIFIRFSKTTQVHIITTHTKFPIMSTLESTWPVY